jgi:hypothetical protein
VVHHATVPENARQLFYQTWPGWTFGAYRAFDLPAEDSFLADLIPWSATFTGHLKGAEAIYNGARGNLVGIRTRLGNIPQHGVLFGMTGAGKSVTIADLSAQIGHRFGFRLIVEEGLSHAVLTQTQGCEPVIINPNGHYAMAKVYGPQYFRIFRRLTPKRNESPAENSQPFRSAIDFMYDRSKGVNSVSATAGCSLF